MTSLRFGSMDRSKHASVALFHHLVRLDKLLLRMCPEPLDRGDLPEIGGPSALTGRKHSWTSIEVPVQRLTPGDRVRSLALPQAKEHVGLPAVGAAQGTEQSLKFIFDAD